MGHFLEPVQCHFCGDYVEDGYSIENGESVRHWLSDCRPDLVEHEIGPDCTWSYRRNMPNEFGFIEGPDMCYGYGEDGKHDQFYKDGPMG